MNYIKIQEYASPVGKLILGSFDNKLCLCDWFHRTSRVSIDSRLKKGLNAEFSEENEPVLTDTIQQLEAYFLGKRRQFNLPLLMTGTDFQKKVWQELMLIPYGKTITYAALSEKLNNPLGIRAIASANGANAISVIVPCHRVIGSDGEMVGYAGGLRVKKKLLQLEGALYTSQLELFQTVITDGKATHPLYADVVKEMKDLLKMVHPVPVEGGKAKEDTRKNYSD